MKQPIFRTAIVAATGLLLWEVASHLFAMAEPWDSPDYWIVCLVALALSGMFGALFPNRAWLWGLLMIFTQLPVMLWRSEPGALLAVGLLFLAALSLPAMAAALLAARLVPRKPRARR